MKLSKNFTLQELMHSTTADGRGIDNTPPEGAAAKLKLLATNALQPIRDRKGSAIVITSGYRSPELNKAIGGAANSQHQKGEAADFVCDSMWQLFLWAKDNIDYDQLIHEIKGSNEWIHISYKESGNRKQSLIFRDGNYSYY